MEKTTLRSISESLLKIIDSGMIFEHVVSSEPLVIEWENEAGIFRYDDEASTVFIKPKVGVESLDMTVTILPTGSIF